MVSHLTKFGLLCATLLGTAMLPPAHAQTTRACTAGAEHTIIPPQPVRTASPASGESARTGAQNAAGESARTGAQNAAGESARIGAQNASGAPVTASADVCN